MCENVAATTSLSGSLSQKLVTVIDEYYGGLSEYKDEELKSLRAEVLRLRGELTRINQGLASTKAGVDLQLQHGHPRVFDSDLYVTFSSQVQDDKDKKVDATESSAPAAREFSQHSVLPGHVSRSKKHNLTFSRDVSPGTYTKASEIEYSALSTLKDSEDHSSLFRSEFSRSIQHLRSMKAAEAEIMDVKKKFHDLDPQNKGYIDIPSLADYVAEYLDGEKSETQIQRYRIALYKLNKKLGILAHTVADDSGTRRSRIEFAAFEVLMLEDVSTLQEYFSPKLAEALIKIRRALVHDVVRQHIAKACNVDVDEVYAGGLTTFFLSVTKWDVTHVLEPAVGTMIIVNTLFLGLSLDVNPDWNGWFALEVFFTFFFLVEFIIRIRLHGCVTHFFGTNWCWNLFDFIIVIFALVDMVVTLLHKSGVSTKLNNLLLVRVIRLIRISRIMRMFRLKIFKELTLMMDGVIAGLNTLFWAMMLLTIVIYSLGLVMKQIMDLEADAYECGASSTKVPRNCNRGEEHMDQYGYVMFGSVGRSMLTIFNCFTDGCISPDGTPLIWHLWDTHGPILVLVYVGVFLFVTFGILNLIMAVFVENTLANAQQQAAERQFGLTSDSVKKAKRLHMLMAKFLKGSTKSVTHMSQEMGTQSVMSRWSFKTQKIEEQPLELDYWQMRVTQDQFEEMMQDVEVHEILDELDISCISRDQIFDILDADGNGFLAVSELIDGIMKLRGPADKGNAVATILAVRQLQKQVSKFEENMQKQLMLAERFPKKAGQLETSTRIEI